MQRRHRNNKQQDRTEQETRGRAAGGLELTAGLLLLFVGGGFLAIDLRPNAKPAFFFPPTSVFVFPRASFTLGDAFPSAGGGGVSYSSGIDKKALEGARGSCENHRRGMSKRLPETKNKNRRFRCWFKTSHQRAEVGLSGTAQKDHTVHASTPA